MSPEVHVGASSLGKVFLGFPVRTTRRVFTGCDLGAAFAIDVANGDPVPDPLRKRRFSNSFCI